jgi:hypothetical protein
MRRAETWVEVRFPVFYLYCGPEQRTTVSWIGGKQVRRFWERVR